MSAALFTMTLRRDNDIVTARQRARDIAGLLGFDAHDQTRVATAVSEAARDTLAQRGFGEMVFLVEGEKPDRMFTILVKSQAKPVSESGSAAQNHEDSSVHLGGLAGAERLMDSFLIECEPGGGETVRMGKKMPESHGRVTLDLQEIASEMGRRIPQDPIEEVRRQNLEMVAVLEALRNRQEELTALNNELEETNRGVMALYAELEERAEYFKKAHEMKARSLSEMSHELRTPINSVLAITQILLDRSDGDLTEEQEKQLRLIKSSSNRLSESINDLLDLSRIEAGKTKVEATHFDVVNLFGILKSMLKPLLYGQPVDLVFDDPVGIPVIFSDEGKIQQILRNLIANAIKFTEQGEVRVSTALTDGGGQVLFGVTDTGVGIAPEHKDLIFEEFSQVTGPLQRRSKGTGLGLPLARKLAAILGGTITFESRPGSGSTFCVALPLHYGEEGATNPE